MFLRNDIEEVMGRTKRFYESDKPGSALILIRSIDSTSSDLSINLYDTDSKAPHMTPLDQWHFPEDLHAYLDEQVNSLVYYWNSRKDIQDDLIPSISPCFGIADHSAFVGGTVKFTKEDTWHMSMINDWTDMDALELREDNKWLGMLIDGAKYLKEKSEGRYVLRLRGADCPMDIANALRGNELFTDFFDYPEELRRLLEFCTRASYWTLSKQSEVVGQFYGGVITGFGVYVPGKSAGHLSEDASTMCSPAIYREFGLPYTQKLVEKYDRVFMHLHPLGRHCFPDIAGIRNADVLDICNDPNCPRSMDIYKDLGDHCLKGKIVAVYPTFEELEENIGFLQQRKSILWYDAKDIVDARRAVDFVRKKLAVM